MRTDSPQGNGGKMYGNSLNLYFFAKYTIRQTATFASEKVVVAGMLNHAIS